jgi:hypothetical protein
MAKYRKGDLVQLSDEAKQNNNYIGWENRELRITHVATSYGRGKGQHPGYDENANGEGLYDLEDRITGESVPFSLYDWEIE